MSSLLSPLFRYLGDLCARMLASAVGETPSCLPLPSYFPPSSLPSLPPLPPPLSCPLPLLTFLSLQGT
eukprot:761023-Hanusia_phi.AAC.4